MWTAKRDQDEQKYMPVQIGAVAHGFFNPTGLLPVVIP
jgi:hypothetical protein